MPPVHCVGEGHVYQGRDKSFPVQSEDYLYQVLRYVERNALRANLVSRAEAWRWSSLWRRTMARQSKNEYFTAGRFRVHGGGWNWLTNHRPMEN